MSFALYVVTGVALLALVHYQVRPLSRPAAVVLLALPLLFTGHALLTGSVYGPSITRTSRHRSKGSGSSTGSARRTTWR